MLLAELQAVVGASSGVAEPAEARAPLAAVASA
jgi:hypothetical protein